MTPDVISVSADWTLVEAAAFLLDNDITGAVVRDAGGEPLGVVTASDLLEAVVEARLPAGATAASQTGAAAASTVREVMTPEVYSVPADAPVQEIARTLLDGGLHRVFVSEGEQLVGTISVSDLLGLLVEEP